MLYIYHHINKIFEVDIEEGALHRNQLAVKKTNIISRYDSYSNNIKVFKAFFSCNQS